VFNVCKGLSNEIINTVSLGKTNVDVQYAIANENMRPPLMENFPEELKKLMRESWHQVTSLPYSCHFSDIFLALYENNWNFTIAGCHQEAQYGPDSSKAK